MRKNRTTTGLIRYDSRSDTTDWAQVVRDMLAAEKPNYIVMMLGLYDRQSIRERLPAPRNPAQPAAGAAGRRECAARRNPPQQPAERAGSPAQPSIAAPEPRRPAGRLRYEFRSDKWAEVYSKRIDDTIAALKSRGVPVFWVGLPSVRGTKSTSDVSYLNDLIKARAEKAGIVYVDVWDGFVDEGGHFALQGPDVEGQTRRLRTADGVHFTKFGARKLAHFLDREIRRVATRGPVRGRAADDRAADRRRRRRGQARRPRARWRDRCCRSPRPAPRSDELLGGGNTPAAVGHVTATRVLVKGEPIASPAGRSDDFTWPRRGVAAFGTDPVVATTTLPLPVMQPPPENTVPAPKGEVAAAAVAPRRTAARRAACAVPTAGQPQPQGGFFCFAVASALIAFGAPWRLKRRRSATAAASSFPSGTCRSRARTGGLRGSPTPPATGRAACRRRRTPSAARSDRRGCRP